MLLSLLDQVIRKKKVNIINQFVLLNAFEKVKHQIRRSDVHPFYEFPYEDMLFTPNINIGIGRLVQNSPSPINHFKDLVDSQLQDYLHFYTHGSKSITESTAGCALVCPAAQVTRM